MLRRDQVAVPIHFLISSSLSAGIYVPTLSPTDLASLSTRLAALADEYAHYRIKSFRFRLHPIAQVATDLAAGVVGGVQDTLPGTIAQVMELLPSTFLGGDTSVPTEWVSVPKQDLAGPLPWYKAIRGSADITEETPGYLCVAGTGTASFSLEVKAVYEFKTAVAPANTPSAMGLRKQLLAERVQMVKERERDQILRLLSQKLGATTTRPQEKADKQIGPQVPAANDLRQPVIRIGGDYP